MSEENPTTSVTPPVEIVANPDFLSWTYPPYCELCNVYFPGEVCSKTHFLGNGHRNRLKIWEKYHNEPKEQQQQQQQQDEEKEAKTTDKKSKPKNVVCRICWKELNTQIMLDTHCKSPAHNKEDKGRLIVQKLKEQYRQLREKQS